MSDQTKLFLSLLLLLANQWYLFVSALAMLWKHANARIHGPDIVQCALFMPFPLRTIFHSFRIRNYIYIICCCLKKTLKNIRTPCFDWGQQLCWTRNGYIHNNNNRIVINFSSCRKRNVFDCSVPSPPSGRLNHLPWMASLYDANPINDRNSSIICAHHQHHCSLFIFFSILIYHFE